ARRSRDEPNVGLAGMPKSPGIAARFKTFLDSSANVPGCRLLRRSYDYCVQKLGFDPDKFIWELTDAVIGDNYPVPDRMLVHCERIVQAYMAKEMCNSHPPAGTLDLFAVE